MNTGTGFDVILADPMPLWMGDQLRAAWLLFAGDLVRKTGIITAIRSMSLLLCGSMLCPAIVPGNGALELFSAVLFGSSFVILTVFAGIWAVHSFHQRPSAGFGLVFLIMSLGQFIGPFTAGLIAELSGLSAAFYFGSGLSALLILITPKDDIRHLTPD